MATGGAGHHGAVVLSLVVWALNRGQECAMIRPQSMVGRIVLVTISRLATVYCCRVMQVKEIKFVGWTLERFITYVLVLTTIFIT